MTAPDVETGRSIAGTLVAERLAACGNVLPGVSSVFRWEGQTQVEAEVLVILKTADSVAAAMLERAADLHPYDVPELLCLPVAEGWAPYLDWVSSEVGGEET
jgi:periplasmic divalent cation tolerance protein